MVGVESGGGNAVITCSGGDDDGPGPGEGMGWWW